MATDYYPRLAAVNKDNLRIKDEVNKQAEIGILIASPIIIIALFLMPVAIRILYSKSFLNAVTYVNWAMLGNIFKIASWAMGYVLLAKGKSQIFICTAIFFNSTYLVLNITGYNWLGMEGLGVAFFIYYIIHFIGIYIICSLFFNFGFQKSFKKLFLSILALSIVAFYIQSVENIWIKYIFAAFVFMVSLYLSYYHLNKKIGIKQIIIKKINKNGKRF